MKYAPSIFKHIKSFYRQYHTTGNSSLNNTQKKIIIRNESNVYQMLHGNSFIILVLFFIFVATHKVLPNVQEFNRNANDCVCKLVKLVENMVKEFFQYRLRIHHSSA